MEWSTYLTRGAFNHTPTESQLIYHMCEENSYWSMVNEGDRSYIPPTFKEDGNFVHATLKPSQLLAIGTYFYKPSKGSWICLEIDPRYLNCLVVYEGAAPVGDIPPMPWVTPGETFPHIYGYIPQLAVRRIYKIVRKEDGTFAEITDLCSSN
jgi:uncharacterized protein (DUF952 family)